MLSGFIQCACCGGSYVIGLHKKSVPHYRCSYRATRGRVVYLNKVTVPRPALEAKVRHIIDAVTQDPKKLEVLVRYHNRRISQANESQVGVVQTLTVRKGRMTEELARVTEAIALPRTRWAASLSRRPTNPQPSGAGNA